MVNTIIDLCQKGNLRRKIFIALSKNINFALKLTQYIYLLTILFYRRDEIIEVLKYRYAEKLSSNLPIFGIDRNNLKEFTTTEKDFKRGQNRFPPN